MEEVLLRFSHLTRSIFQKLDNFSLIRCREVNISWQNIIDLQREISIRRIQKLTKCSQKSVKNILRRKNIKDLTFLANQIQNIYTDKYPLHLAARRGLLEVCSLILDNLKKKNPENVVGYTPLHFAAENGHHEVCCLILEKVQKKNPKDPWTGWTPLHYAAKNGHSKTCQLILQNVHAKNPKNSEGSTPLQLAAEYGHMEAYQVIETQTL